MFKTIRSVTRLMTLLLSLAIVAVSLISYNNIVRELDSSEGGYDEIESRLRLEAEEILRNVAYSAENERDLFERHVDNELFYLLSYREINANQELPNLSSFLHYKTVEDILYVEDGIWVDHNPMTLFFDDMDGDEQRYMLSSLRNNAAIQTDGYFYYYWPSYEGNRTLDRKVIYYITGENGAAMLIGFKTRDYDTIVRGEVTDWMAEIYVDDLEILDRQTGLVLNDGLIDNFNLSRITMDEDEKERFIYETDGTRTRIIHMTNLEDLELIIARQTEVTDYSNLFLLTFSDKRVLGAIIAGILAIILIRLMEYAWMRRILDENYFDKRFIYESLEFCRDGVAVLDSRFTIDDCNNRFKILLGLDVLIKGNYNLKKMIPDFHYAKETYSMVFMNKKAEYIDVDVITKKIDDRYIVKLSPRHADKMVQYLEFKSFSLVIDQRAKDREGFVENLLFAMVSVENGIRIDYLMNRLHTYFVGQGLIVLISAISPEERIMYVEGLRQSVFEDIFDNIVEQAMMRDVSRVYRVSLQLGREQCPVDLESVMQDLDYKLYEAKKANV